MNNAAKYKQLLPIWGALHRYHLVLFVLIACGGLAVATFFLYNTINDSTKVEQTTISTGFDKATIKRVNELQTANQQAQTPPMSNRNPFVE